MKTCKICDKTKPLEAFTRNKNERDGLRGECTDCRKQARRDRAVILAGTVTVDWSASKQCSFCNESKVATEFHRNRHGSDGLSSLCRSCKRDIWYEYEFGITKAEYDAIASRQGGRCAVCHNPEVAKHSNGDVKLLAVDHNHETGMVRGLLCSQCNRGLGMFADSPDILRSALAYLKRHLDQPTGKRVPHLTRKDRRSQRDADWTTSGLSVLRDDVCSESSWIPTP